MQHCGGTRVVVSHLAVHTLMAALKRLGRYENLAEDLPEAVHIINQRRDPSLSPIPEPTIYWKKKGVVRTDCIACMRGGHIRRFACRQ